MHIWKQITQFHWAPAWMAQTNDRWDESRTFHRPTTSCAVACSSARGSPHIRLLSERMRRRERLRCLRGALSWSFPKLLLIQRTPRYACDVMAATSPCMISRTFAHLTHKLVAYYFLQVDGTCSCKHDRSGVDCSLVRSLEIDMLSFSH